jgi:hypothetical protein
MAEGSYELGARVGLGIKMAHEAALKYSTSGQEYSTVLGDIVEPIIELVIATQAKHLVTDAFPGATVERGPLPTPQQNVQQHVAQVAPAGTPQPAGPPPVPNRSTGGDWKQQQAEEAFQLFVQDTTAWDDVRANKRSPSSPDFRHKWVTDPPNKEGKVYKKSLWLKDAPEWAKPQLAQMGLTP